MKTKSTDILHVGDNAWAIYQQRVYPCSIEGLPFDATQEKNMAIVRFKDTVGLRYFDPEDIFLIRTEAAVALHFRIYDQLQTYLQEIQTVDDLYDFPLHHSIAGNMPDYAARMAYKLKREELIPNHDPAAV